MDMDLLIKRYGIICKKVRTCLENLADFYVVKKGEFHFTAWILQHL